jgi:hypothetical protein
MVVYVAVVHAGGEIAHVTAAPSAQDLTERLADYVRAHLDRQLWPADAGRVRRLLAEGRSADAVSHYFATVGKWDPERLETREMELAMWTGAPDRV